MPRLKPGSRFGLYTIRRPLGRGAMGQVFQALDPQGQKVALKLLTAKKKRARDRFLREVEVGTAIDHPNVVRVLDSGEVDGIPFLTMEYIQGKDLGEVLRSIGRFDPRVVLRFSRHLARGLTEFHSRNYVHRDIKPANLLVTPEGHLRIADLGLVHDPLDKKLTHTGMIVGTPWYLSPEQASGKRATAASDCFAMALVLFIALTGTHPFRLPEEEGEENFLQYLIRLPRATPAPWHSSARDGPLDLLFRRALATDPEDRPGSVRRLAREMEQAFRAEKERGRPVQETQRLLALKKRS